MKKIVNASLVLHNNRSVMIILSLLITIFAIYVLFENSEVAGFLKFEPKYSASVKSSFRTGINSDSNMGIKNSESLWNKYQDSLGEYEFFYPDEYTIDHIDGSSSPLVLNKRITWNVRNVSIEGCSGDCPVITSSKRIVLNGRDVLFCTGWVGSIGGDIPQSFVTYEFKNPNKEMYVSLTLWELGQTKEILKNASPLRNHESISEEDGKSFLKIVETFRFL